MRRKILIYILALIVLTGCRKSMTYSEFNDWWSSHSKDFVQTKKFSEVSFVAGFIPSEVFMAKNANWIGENEEHLLAIELRYYLKGGENLLYYNIQDEPALKARMAYFQGAFKEESKIIFNNSEFPCHDVHVEQTAGITPYTSILLYFLNQGSLDFDKETELTFQFRDEIFKNGIINIRIDNLNDIPEIKKS